MCTQRELYEDFARSRAKQGVDDTLSEDGTEKKTNTQATTHIFQVPYFYSFKNSIFLNGVMNTALWYCE